MERIEESMKQFVHIGIWEDYLIYHHQNSLSIKYKNLYCPNVIDSFPRWKNYLYRFHNNLRINRILQLPFKKKWASHILPQEFMNRIDCNDEVFFIFGSSSLLFVYNNLQGFLKKRYPRAMFVFNFVDRVSLYKKTFRWFTIESIKKEFDLVYSYNKYDCMEYDLVWNPSTIINQSYSFSISSKTIDVFFVGLDKGRLDILLKIYKLCKSYNLSVLFYIGGVKEENIENMDGIIYNHKLTYNEIREIMTKAKCILNVQQPGASGLTLRDIEAIESNSFLMTHNDTLEKSDLYTPEKIIDYEKFDDEIYKLNDPKCISKKWNNTSAHSIDNYYDWLINELKG